MGEGRAAGGSTGGISVGMEAGAGRADGEGPLQGGRPVPSLSHLEDVDGEDEVRGALVHLKLAVAVLEGHKLLEEGREGVLMGREGASDGIREENGVMKMGSWKKISWREGEDTGRKGGRGLRRGGG